jgi:hypothetical protein
MYEFLLQHIEFAAFAPRLADQPENRCRRSLRVIMLQIFVKRVTMLIEGLVSLRRIAVKNSTFAGLAVAFGLLVPVAPVFAHHSFAAEFDGTKQISLTGIVTKVDWVNPHAYIYVDVKGDDGSVINWAIETGAPNMLYRQGWRKDDLKAGDTVTLTAFLAKDGSHTAAARSVKLPDGRNVFAGTPNSTPDQK